MRKRFRAKISVLPLTTFGGTAIAAWLFAGQPAKNNSGGAAYIGVHFDSGHRAIFGASPALHTTVLIGNYRFAVFNAENTVRANFRTLSAPDTFIC